MERVCRSGARSPGWSVQVFARLCRPTPENIDRKFEFTVTRLTTIDLFSGAGGMSCGFEKAGFKSVLAVEMDKAAALTYEANFDVQVLQRPIEELPNSWFPEVDVVIGGPPCQGFSPLGKMTTVERHKSMNKLWRHFLRVVEIGKPKAFVIENVPEILKSFEFEALKEQALELGYSVEADVLNAYDYGVPQRRRRAFIVGVKGRFTGSLLPSPVKQRKNVRDAIGDLPLEPTDKDWHIGRNPTPKSLERYKCVPPGGNRFDLMRARPDITPQCWLNKPNGSTDVFGRMEWDKPSLTIRTEFYKPEKGCYLHPAAHRPITHREAARLQTFPDDFRFEGSKTEVARQIGNAVPPVLAYAVAANLARVLKSHEEENEPVLEDLQLQLV